MPIMTDKHKNEKNMRLNGVKTFLSMIISGFPNDGVRTPGINTTVKKRYSPPKGNSLKKSVVFGALEKIEGIISCILTPIKLDANMP